jgi:hypothetical protein
MGAYAACIASDTEISIINRYLIYPNSNGQNPTFQSLEI